MSSLKLYSGAESGNSWKVRILLEQLELPYEKILIDLLKWEHKTKDFFANFNPRGQVPVLEDDGRRIWDSTAIMVYLARKTNRTDWLPIDPAGMAEVMQWVSLASSEILFGLQYARRGMMRDRWVIGGKDQLPQYQTFGKMALNAMEGRLRDAHWLAADHITIADIACFPYVLHAPQAGLPLDEYKGIQTWLDRCQALPRWAEAPKPPTRHYDDMPADRG